MKFIVWDPKDGNPQRENGTLVSDGILGRLGEDNVYINVYANYDDKHARELDVGQFALATFNLSGEKKTYQVYRVSEVES